MLDADVAGDVVEVGSSVTRFRGSNAVQLAAAAGYDVLTTASPHTTTRSRTSAPARPSTTAAPPPSATSPATCEGALAGTIAIGTESAKPCLDIVHAASGSKLLATASTAVSFERLADTPRPSSDGPAGAHRGPCR